MEITNEIKAKVFAQYLGQKAKCVFLDNSGEYTGIIECVSLEKEGIIFVVAKFDVGNWNGRMPDEVKLILKPLSKITDEDLEGLYDIERPQYKITVPAIKMGKAQEYINNESITFKNGQFLQSKGYDLPNFYLGGKTLHESGLAIYE